MKDLLINCVNWIFESHALSMPGWMWIVAPIFIGIAVFFLAVNIIGFIIENMTGLFWNR